MHSCLAITYFNTATAATDQTRETRSQIQRTAPQHGKELFSKKEKCQPQGQMLANNETGKKWPKWWLWYKLHWQFTAQCIISRDIKYMFTGPKEDIKLPWTPSPLWFHSGRVKNKARWKFSQGDVWRPEVYFSSWHSVLTAKAFCQDLLLTHHLLLTFQWGAREEEGFLENCRASHHVV